VTGKETGSILAGIIVGTAFLIAVAVASSLPLPMALLVIIALAMMIPETYDIFLAYQNKKDGEPTGIVGLGRVLMAFGIILVVGAAAFQILAIITTNLETLPTNFSSLDAKLISSNITSQETDKIIDMVSKNNEAIIDVNTSFVDAIKTILTTLGGAISAIIGFYFGQKSVTGEEKKQPDEPILNAVAPAEGKPGDTVMLSGTNLGSSQNGSVVAFGSINQLKSIDWNTTSIKVEVPQGLPIGTTTIMVIVNGVTSNKISFTVKP
jgi:hypothetical protein